MEWRFSTQGHSGEGVQTWRTIVRSNSWRLVSVGLDCYLLCARRERPCGRAAEQRDEVAPFHVEHGGTSSPMRYQRRRLARALGFPAPQPAIERRPNPWGRPELF